MGGSGCIKVGKGGCRVSQYNPRQSGVASRSKCSMTVVKNNGAFDSARTEWGYKHSLLQPPSARQKKMHYAVFVGMQKL